MRFFTPLLCIAAAFGLASSNPVNVNVARQEAARFGSVTVEPSTVNYDGEITITYNSSKALAQPRYLDVYIQGTLSSGFVEPYYLLGRFDYGNATVLEFQSTLPKLYTSPTNGYSEDAGYDIWAFITYPSPDGGAYVVGGTSAGLSVTTD
ncbi:hypothetical protein NM688_g7907 [Phlebia brevispora]|uniref:Uncharacterized protein n=1 Tax=Phlebia brevispora TaxID=194682 RepID=A0ACC1RZU0_9APHY|nr:hypothetical protein NM688_g7907 [Phlebia brevispora]